MNANTLQKPLQFTLNISDVPPLLDAKGVKTHIAPIGRTLLYHLASTDEIQSVSLGIGKKGKRLFITQSIVAWIQRRAAQTKRPALGGKTQRPETTISTGDLLE